MSDVERGEAIEMMGDRIEDLEADNARLRALLVDARCNWCGVDLLDTHSETCSAFTPDGRVKSFGYHARVEMDDE